MSSHSWTEVLSSLPDSGFFEVVRHYLGPVSTPFHKPDLISRMEAFFRREDVHQRLFEYLDEDDVRLLTIIAYLDGVTGGRLAGMTPDLRYVAFREKLLNLEERLLIWSRPSGKVRHYTLTPLGEEVRDSGVLGPGTVTGEGAAGPVVSSSSWLNDNFLTCSLAFLSDRQLLFRKEGGWRKKALEMFAEAFPGIFRDGQGEDRLIMAGRGMLSMGLVERRGERLIPDLAVWKELESMNADDRLALVRARSAVGRAVSSKFAIQATRLLSDALPLGRYYDPLSLATLFQLATGSALLSPAGARRVISHLELMGVLVDNGEGLLGRSRSEPTDITARPLLTMTPVGDVSLQPGSPLFCNLALAAGPGRLDVLAGFTLNKTAYQAGLENGVRSPRLFEEIEKRSGHPVPENIRIQCTEWESEHRELNLEIGVILRAEGLRKEILESTGILDEYALERPAPGIWILDPSDEEGWRTALAGVGIERIPPLKTRSGLLWDPLPSSAGAEETPRIGWTPRHEISPLTDANWKSFQGIDISGILEELRKKAENEGLSPEEMTAFEERLERRVILVPDQIRKGAWRFEVMTAKGLDYRGKIRLAEAALTGRDERLAVTIASGIDIETVLVLPRKLEKEGDDHILVGITLPEEQAVRYKIRKIGLLKRIKASLF